MKSLKILLTTLALASVVGCHSRIPPGPVVKEDKHVLSANNKALALPLAPVPAAVPTTPTPACNGTDLSANAICEFAALTSAGSLWTGAGDTVHTGSISPIWTQWLDKCNLGLVACTDEVQLSGPGDCPPIPVQGSHAPFINPGRRPSSDILALDIATQNRLANVADPAPPSGSDQKGNELASVLMSPELCREVETFNTKAQMDAANTAATQKNLAGGDRDIAAVSDTDDIIDNATAVKLIWEVVIPSDPTATARVFYPDSGDNLQQGLKYGRANGWSTRYTINPDDTALCPTTIPDQQLSTPSMKAPSLEINCFYHFPVNLADKAVQAVLGNNPNVVSQPVSGTTPSAYAILVGVHVMVFNQTHRLWQWMTFYWTPGVNAQGWKDPWQHYQMMTTSSPGQGQPLEKNYPTIASPYLEAGNDGVNSNCLSCHSLAVYNPNNKSALVQPNKAALNVDKYANTLPLGEYPRTENAAISRGYFNNAIRTHFLWSMTNNPALYGTAAPAASHVAQTHHQ